MVMDNTFQDILDASSKVTQLNIPSLKKNPLKIEFGISDVLETVYDGLEPVLPFAQSEAYCAQICNWRRLTAVHEDCKPVYEVTFNIKGSNFVFQPGDTIGIIPHNTTSEVNSIVNHLDLTPLVDVSYNLSVCTSQKGKVPPHVPVKSTLRHVLTHCLDLRGVVKKLFLLALSAHTDDENEKRVLQYICSKEGSNAYTTHILNRNLCILDIFTIFKSCKPPVEILLANLPRLLPRPYSIINVKDLNVLKICFSVMDIDNKRKGLTTSWLEEVILEGSSLESVMEKLSIQNGERRKVDVPMYIRKNIGGFSMPDVEIPLLLVGPGTGVAPFIGFLKERELQREMDPSKSLGEVWLYFGCRNPKLDFIFEKELNEFVSKGILTKLKTAFSRIENEIKYVQDALMQDGENVAKFIKQGCAIFVCGDHKCMATQVKDNFVRCLVKYNQISLEEAETFINNMQKDKRYVVDVWS